MAEPSKLSPKPGQMNPTRVGEATKPPVNVPFGPSRGSDGQPIKPAPGNVSGDGNKAA